MSINRLFTKSGSSYAAQALQQQRMMAARSANKSGTFGKAVKYGTGGLGIAGLATYLGLVGREIFHSKGTWKNFAERFTKHPDGAGANWWTKLTHSFAKGAEEFALLPYKFTQLFKKSEKFEDAKEHQ